LISSNSSFMPKSSPVKLNNGKQQYMIQCPSKCLLWPWTFFKVPIIDTYIKATKNSYTAIHIC
jgi:hypothetical protein